MTQVYITYSDGNTDRIPCGLPYPFNNVDTFVRTKASHPYNYDPYTIWRNKTRPADALGQHSIYTDRLYSWDAKKLLHLEEKHFGEQPGMWDQRDPVKIEAFLSDWTGKPVTLVRVIEYCNPASGYPLWCLLYDEK